MAAVAAFSAGLGMQSAAVAHPHVWVESQSTLKFDGGRLVGVKHAWTFDEAFSIYAVQGLDENRDGIYSREELQPLAKVNVTSLNEFDFFTFLFDGEADVPFGEPVDYWLDRDQDGILTLHFTLPLQEPHQVSSNLELDVYDPTYFIAFSFVDKEPVTMASAPEGCSANLQRAGELDAQMATALAAIPATESVAQEDLFTISGTISNTVQISCK